MSGFIFFPGDALAISTFHVSLAVGLPTAGVATGAAASTMTRARAAASSMSCPASHAAACCRQRWRSFTTGAYSRTRCNLRSASSALPHGTVLSSD